jgi:lipoprotein-anchoring transpeptidase ErfK/SrfK
VRSPTFIGVAAFVALLILGSVGVWAYDASRDDKVADGVRVGGVLLGGLSEEQARAKLERELMTSLQTPVRIEARHRTFRLSPERAKVEVDVDALVDEAIDRSRKGSVVARTWRSLTGGEVEANIEPEVSYDNGVVRRLIRRIGRRTERKPRDATVDFSAGSLEKVEAHYGVRMDEDNLEAKIDNALQQPDASVRTLHARVRKVQPKVTTSELARKYDIVVTVDRANFKLRLWKRLKLAKEYGIAVGMVGLETPAGLYHVQNKAVNPAWSVPNSAWAGDLAGTVVPGGTPQNPLKARWLGIYNGAGIHGTDAAYSIGSNASHGCIRMLIPDVIELYDEVPVGAPVYIA